jgi:heme/copper-type cytochrome/quinol oxidase subunit 3
MPFLVSSLGILAGWWGCYGLSYVLPLRDPQDPSKKLVNLGFKERADVAEKLMNSPFFLMVAALAMKATSELRGTQKSRWHGHSTASIWCLSLYTSRMIWDSIHQRFSMAHEPKKQREMLAHHVLSALATGSGLASMKCHFWGCFDVCCEITTVCLNNVFALKYLDVGKLQGPLTALNGLGLWLGFLVFRLTLFPTWLLMYFKDVRGSPEQTWRNIHPVFRYLYPSTNVFLLTLSSIWFVPITTGLLKVLGGKNKKLKKGTSEDSSAQ